MAAHRFSRAFCRADCRGDCSSASGSSLLEWVAQVHGCVYGCRECLPPCLCVDDAVVEGGSRKSRGPAVHAGPFARPSTRSTPLFLSCKSPITFPSIACSLSPSFSHVPLDWSSPSWTDVLLRKVAHRPLMISIWHSSRPAGLRRRSRHLYPRLCGMQLKSKLLMRRQKVTVWKTDLRCGWLRATQRSPESIWWWVLWLL